MQSRQEFNLLASPISTVFKKSLDTQSHKDLSPYAVETPFSARQKRLSSRLKNLYIVEDFKDTLDETCLEDYNRSLRSLQLGHIDSQGERSVEQHRRSVRSLPVSMGSLPMPPGSSRSQEFFFGNKSDSNFDYDHSPFIGMEIACNHAATEDDFTEDLTVVDAEERDTNEPVATPLPGGAPSKSSTRQKRKGRDSRGSRRIEMPHDCLQATMETPSREVSLSPEMRGRKQVEEDASPCVFR